MIGYEDLLELTTQLELLARTIHTREEDNTVDVLLADAGVDRDELLKFIAERIPVYKFAFSNQDYVSTIASVYLDAFLMGYFVARKIEGSNDG